MTRPQLKENVRNLCNDGRALPWKRHDIGSGKRVDGELLPAAPRASVEQQSHLRGQSNHVQENHFQPPTHGIWMREVKLPP